MSSEAADIEVPGMIIKADQKSKMVIGLRQEIATLTVELKKRDSAIQSLTSTYKPGHNKLIQQCKFIRAQVEEHGRSNGLFSNVGQKAEAVNSSYVYPEKAETDTDIVVHLID